MTSNAMSNSHLKDACDSIKYNLEEQQKLLLVISAEVSRDTNFKSKQTGLNLKFARQKLAALITEIFDISLEV